jgi:hypothetical protein
MWRISNDIWDGWHFHHDPGTDDYPSGVDTAFVNLPKWNAYVRPGAWPDADMLPLGSLRPNPGYGEPRESLLSHDEQWTLFSLWAISRSPLMLGANLTIQARTSQHDMEAVGYRRQTCGAGPLVRCDDTGRSADRGLIARAWQLNLSDPIIAAERLDSGNARFDVNPLTSQNQGV